MTDMMRSPTRHCVIDCQDTLTQTTKPYDSSPGTLFDSSLCGRKRSDGRLFEPDLLDPLKDSERIDITERGGSFDARLCESANERAIRKEQDPKCLKNETEKWYRHQISCVARSDSRRSNGSESRKSPECALRVEARSFGKRSFVFSRRGGIETIPDSTT